MPAAIDEVSLIVDLNEMLDLSDQSQHLGRLGALHRLMELS